MSYANLLLRPDLGKKAYRLHCRFKIGAHPSERILEKAKNIAAERFIDDLKMRGWHYASKYGFNIKGPFPYIEPMRLEKPIRLTAQQMLPRLLQGERFRSQMPTGVRMVLPLEENEYWEYELTGVFVHNTILVEHLTPEELAKERP